MESLQQQLKESKVLDPVIAVGEAETAKKKGGKTTETEEGMDDVESSSYGENSVGHVDASPA